MNLPILGILYGAEILALNLNCTLKRMTKPLNEIVKISINIPKIGKFIVGNSKPYNYLINSIEDFYNQDELLELIKKNKFYKSEYRNLSGGVVAIHSAWKV